MDNGVRHGLEAPHQLDAVRLRTERVLRAATELLDEGFVKRALLHSKLHSRIGGILSTLPGPWPSRFVSFGAGRLKAVQFRTARREMQVPCLEANKLAGSPSPEGRAVTPGKLWPGVGVEPGLSVCAANLQGVPHEMHMTKLIGWVNNLGVGLSVVLGSCFMLVACGGDGDSGDGGGQGSAGGGSCVTSDGCWHVEVPGDYDVKTECSFVQGAWSAQLCDPTGYARKCTQVTQVSINDGPEMDVTYVYFWPADSMYSCLGTEEML